MGFLDLWFENVEASSYFGTKNRLKTSYSVLGVLNSKVGEKAVYSEAAARLSCCLQAVCK